MAEITVTTFADARECYRKGIDRPQGTPEETFHLYDYLTTFIEGATLAHYTGDKEAKAAEVLAARPPRRPTRDGRLHHPPLLQPLPSGICCLSSFYLLC